MSESTNSTIDASINGGSTTPTAGKDAKGKFAKGNKLGRGNPLAGRAAKIRAELLKASTTQDVKIITQRLIEGAKSGDLAFIREWLDRTIGKAHQEVTQHIDHREPRTEAERDAARDAILARIRARLNLNGGRN